jgi:hypothetical protein
LVGAIKLNKKESFLIAHDLCCSLGIGDAPWCRLWFAWDPWQYFLFLLLYSIFRKAFKDD